MRKSIQLLVVGFMLLPVPTIAHEFPTDATVLFVLNCMSGLGGVRDENMYTCVCRHDAMAEAMSYSDYEEAVTFERNRAMPGEKGNFFRDNERGRDMYLRLVEARKEIDQQCIKVKHIVPKT